MIDSTDGRLLNNAINPNNVLPDSQRSNVGIQVRTGGITRYQQHDGPATHRQNATSVQLQPRTGRVEIAGTSVTPEVLETLKESAPQLFVPEAEKAAQAATEAAADAKEEADRLDLNTHPDSDVEGAHMLFTHEVPDNDQIALLVQMHRDGAPSTSTLHRVAQAMGLSVDQAVDKLNGMSIGVQAQLKAFTNARGVDDVKFAEWMRSSRREESLKALTQHVMQRDLVGAWGEHIADFAARTGPKR